MYGRNFTVVTDHTHLTWVFNVKDPSSRLLSWTLKLEEYDYDVVYKPRARNTNAHALSRINVTEASSTNSNANSVLTDEGRRGGKRFYRNFVNNRQ